jgi:hypothetical protein
MVFRVVVCFRLFKPGICPWQGAEKGFLTLPYGRGSATLTLIG